MPGVAKLSARLILAWAMIFTGVEAANPYRLNAQYENGDGYMSVRLLGAVELPFERLSGHDLLGLSGLAWDNDDQVLYALSDRGVLFHLRPEFSAGFLTDVEVLEAFALWGIEGRRLKGHSADAEGLAILSGRNGVKGDAKLLISFERVPRINQYSPSGQFEQRYALPQSLQLAYRGSNRAFESVTFMQPMGILTAPEHPIEHPNGNTHLIVDLQGSSWSFPRFDAPASALVAIEAMSDGSMITLERSFVSMWQPLRIILRRTSALPTTAR